MPLQAKLQYDFKGFAKENAAACAALPLDPVVGRVLEQETLLAGAPHLPLLLFFLCFCCCTVLLLL